MKKKKGIAMSFYRVERWLLLHGFKKIANIWFRLMQLILGCTIPPSCNLEEGVTIAHFHGIVFAQSVYVGSGTIIYQNVTLGGAKGRGGPKIGKNCIIGAGAVILGEIIIGDNCNIGANAVVLKDVPANSVAVGVPCKILNKKNMQ